MTAPSLAPACWPWQLATLRCVARSCGVAKVSVASSAHGTILGTVSIKKCISLVKTPIK